MKGMISREVKRVKFMRACGDNHDFTDKPIRDPVDRRRILKPQLHQNLFDGLYDMVVCRSCGIFKAVPSTEIEERRKLLEGENRVFILNEGTCPNCYHDVKLTDVSGTKAFLSDHQPKEGVESRQWEDPLADDWVVGSFTFKCQNPECGKEHYIEQMRDGDWA